MDANNKCFFRIINVGLFVSRFSISYTYKGQARLISSGNFAISQIREIDVPCDATNITLKVEIAVFFGTYKTIYQGNFKTAAPRCFALYGYTFLPGIIQRRCDFAVEQYLPLIRQQLNYYLGNSQSDICPTMCPSYPYFFQNPSSSNTTCS